MIVVILIISIFIGTFFFRLIYGNTVFFGENPLASKAGKYFTCVFVTLMVLSFFANKIGLIDLDTYNDESQTQQVETGLGVDDLAEDGDEVADIDDEMDETELEDGESDAAMIEEDGADEKTMSQQYICPNSDRKKLTKKEILSLSSEERRLARNEIYARHGRRFADGELQNYFDQMDWYEGTIEPEDFSESLLSKIEKKNVKLLSKYE